MGPQNPEFQIPQEAGKTPEAQSPNQPEYFVEAGQKNPEKPIPKDLLQSQTTADPQAAIQQVNNAIQISGTDGSAQAVAAVPSQQSKTDDVKRMEVLEKTAVAKAKTIINQTKNDPFTQKNELSRAKVQYLKERYNKEIKSLDTSAKT